MTRRIALSATLAAFLTASFLVAPTPVAAADPVLVGAGDISDCGSAKDEETATLLDGIPGTVVTFGDNAYSSGTAAQYRDCYDPTWGRHKARTKPSAGNHEYETKGASGYFGYFGAAAGAAAQGWYSYDLGRWHMIVLNSNCSDVGCGSNSAQVKWLRADLAAHAGANVIAYWHHPRFSSGAHGNDTSVAAFWDALYAGGADIVLNGHDHDYERFAPQDPSGRADPAHGIREFVVGTGGRELRARASNAKNSQVFSKTFGVLKLTLHASSYDWQFVPIAGTTFTDRGTGTPHGPTAKSFKPVADAWVDQRHPNANHGASPKLFVDGNVGRGRDLRTYLKFKVTGLVGTVDRAVLRLWVTNPTRNGPTVAPTRTGWSAGRLTWRNRPGPTGPVVADAGALAAGRWADFNVTALVHGNGTYAFLLRSVSGDGLSAWSAQGVHAPRLVLRVAAP
jgi:Calcineurin-like phosphoesterase